jgi:hypothetical protein
MLVTPKRFRLRYLRQWLHHGLRRLQCRLHRTRTAWPWLATLVTRAASTEILRAHLHGAHNALRSRNHPRLHAECVHRLMRRCGDNSGCDARINRNATAAIPVLDPNRTINDHGPAEHGE